MHPSIRFDSLVFPAHFVRFRLGALYLPALEDAEIVAFSPTHPFRKDEIANEAIAELELRMIGDLPIERRGAANPCHTVFVEGTPIPDDHDIGVTG